MPYAWKKDKAATKYTANLESFWFFVEFTVNNDDRKLTVGDGFFAACVSQQSGPPEVGKPGPKDNSFEIGDGKNKVKLRHATFVQSRLVEFSNELNHLHLFQFNNGAVKTEWIDAQGWKPGFTEPTENENNTPFWPHKMTFGECSGRYAYTVLSKVNGAGTRSVGLVLPFLEKSALSVVLGHHDKDVPELSVTVQARKPWTYFPGSLKTFPGDVRGYVMVAQGGFKQIALGGDLEAWLGASSGGKKKVAARTPDDVADRLSAVLHGAGALQRTLETAEDMTHDSVVLSGSDRVMEVLFLDSLNNRNPVPGLL